MTMREDNMVAAHKLGRAIYQQSADLPENILRFMAKNRYDANQDEADAFVAGFLGERRRHQEENQL